MSIIPPPVVDGPEPRGRRYGLFAAAIGPLDLPMPHGRGGGVTFEPHSCGDAHPYPIECDTAEKVTQDEAGIVEAAPFAVTATIECGTVGHTTAEDETRVLRRLESGEQRAAERALWSGQTDAGDSLDIDALVTASDLVTPPDAESMASVVGALEQWLYADLAYGHTGYLHAQPIVAAYAADRGLVVRDGPLLRTPLGSIWVFGGGYPGTGEGGAQPDGDDTWLHASGLVTVWRAPEPWVAPVDQTTDRGTNQRLLLAEREYAVGFECGVGRALFQPGGS
ncbi:MAG: hypothetical protein ACOC96_10275 [Actinomycetota bacterium]